MRKYAAEELGQMERDFESILKRLPDFLDVSDNDIKRVQVFTETALEKLKDFAWWWADTAAKYPESD